MPRGLDRSARRMWRRLAPPLEKLGLLTELDGPMFILVVRAWARLEGAERRLQQILAPAGTLTDEHARLVRKVEISVERAEHSFRLLAAEFGLSPTSRSRLNVPPMRDEDDEFEEFLSRGRGGGRT